MTELPGLPPLGAAPAFGPDDEAYGAVVGRALNRRRRRLAAASAATAMAVAFAWVSGPSANGRSGLTPTDTPPPVASAPVAGESPTPEPAATAAPGEPAATATPGEGTAPTAEPATEPRPEPTDDAGCGTHAGGWTDCHTTGDEPRPRPEWREAVALSDGEALAGCAHDEAAAQAGWCFRILGPESVQPSAGAEFSAELCRVGEYHGQGVSYAELDHDRDLAITLAGADGDGDGSPDHVASSARRLRPEPHRRDVPTGRCLRWTVAWNGVADDGRVLPAGEYTLTMRMLGHTPRRPFPGEPDQSTKTTHSDTWPEYRVG